MPESAANPENAIRTNGTFLEAAVAYAASHPDREEARIVAGVLRSGATWCAIRQRAHDEDDMVLTGNDLVPALLQLLYTTLEPDSGVPQNDE